MIARIERIAGPQVIGVDQREKGGIGRVTQGSPYVEKGQATGSILDLATVEANGPPVEVILSIGLVLLLPGNLSQQNVAAVGHVVPVDGPGIRVVRGLVLIV